MELKYIYSEWGEVEAVILPVTYWKRILNALPGNFEKPEKSMEEKPFDPASFRGKLGLNLSLSDLESSLNSLRDEWNRNI